MPPLLAHEAKALMSYLLISGRRIGEMSELGGKKLHAAFSWPCGVAGDVSPRRLEVRVHDRVPFEPRGSERAVLLRVRQRS